MTMIGDLILVVLVLLVFVALCLAAWLAYQNVQLAKSAQATSSSALELIEKQAALIAAKDALAYQAIRAVDVYGSYDEGSNEPEVEEIAGGFGADGDPAEAVGFNGDPFVSGNIFDKKL